jgi:hypothetical protein
MKLGMLELNQLHRPRLEGGAAVFDQER